MNIGVSVFFFPKLEVSPDICPGVRLPKWEVPDGEKDWETELRLVSQSEVFFMLP